MLPRRTFLSCTAATLGFFSVLPAADPIAAPKKPDAFYLLPEPRSMRSKLSRPLADAALTVFSPARKSANHGEIQTYSSQEFAKLGIGWESFKEQCVASANQRLTTLTPEYIKDDTGAVIYAVYRGEDPALGCLLIASALSKIFEKTFGDTLWLVTPDRHSLYVFPAKSAALSAFAADLKDRFTTDPLATSEEIFELQKSGGLHVIGNYSGHFVEPKAQ